MRFYKMLAWKANPEFLGNSTLPSSVWKHCRYPAHFLLNNAPEYTIDTLAENWNRNTQIVENCGMGIEKISSWDRESLSSLFQK